MYFFIFALRTSGTTVNTFYDIYRYLEVNQFILANFLHCGKNLRGSELFIAFKLFKWLFFRSLIPKSVIYDYTIFFIFLFRRLAIVECFKMR